MYLQGETLIKLSRTRRTLRKPTERMTIFRRLINGKYHDCQFAVFKINGRRVGRSRTAGMTTEHVPRSRSASVTYMTVFYFYNIDRYINNKFCFVRPLFKIYRICTCELVQKVVATTSSGYVL